MKKPETVAQATADNQLQRRRFDPNTMPIRMHRAEHIYSRYFIGFDSTVRPSDILDPDFWAHQVEHFRPNDVIEIAAPRFEMEVRVLRVDRSYDRARPILRLLRVWPADLEIELPTLAGIEYRVEKINNTYRALASDGRVLAGGFRSEAELIREMEMLEARYGIALAEQLTEFHEAGLGKPQSAAD
jgi:hypothetical protein